MDRTTSRVRSKKRKNRHPERLLPEFHLTAWSPPTLRLSTDDGSARWLHRERLYVEETIPCIVHELAGRP